MKVRARYAHWFPKLVRVDAITIYPYVLFTAPKEAPSTLETVKHECVHVRQVRRLGIVRFSIAYAWELLVLLCGGRTYTQAIHEISYEVEAYRDEKTIELTADERAEFDLT